jgi:hypothetical protein
MNSLKILTIEANLTFNGINTSDFFLFEKKTVKEYETILHCLNICMKTTF